MSGRSGSSAEAIGVSSWRLCRLAVAVAGGALLSGCYNLDAVQSVSGKVVSASQAWDGPAGEMEQSCIRRRQFASNPDDCVSDKQATEGLLAADKIIHDYFAAIQATANQQNFTVDQGVKNLSTSVAQVKNVNATQIQAVSGLAQVLSNLALGAYREHALRRLIDDGAPHAGHVLDFLQTTAADDLDVDLQAEQIQLTTQFSSGQYIPDMAAKLGLDPAKGCKDGPIAGKFSGGPEFLVALEFCRREADLQNKQRALDDYRKSVSSARQALTELQSSKVRLSSAELAKKLFQIAQDLDDHVSKVRSAFKGS